MGFIIEDIEEDVGEGLRPISEAVAAALATAEATRTSLKGYTDLPAEERQTDGSRVTPWKAS